MIYQTEINFEKSIEAKNSGMDRAITSAEHTHQEWTAEALNHVRKFIRNVRAKTFLMEDVSQYAYQVGLPRPPSERAWGSIAHKAQKCQLIKKIGIANVSRKSAHRAYANLYAPISITD